MLPDKLLRKLGMRHFSGNMRRLKSHNNLIDFASNDYLGFSKIPMVEESILLHGATGSRLLSGHSKAFDTLENRIAHFHKSENALIFNSGYDANLGLISSVAQRGDLILYDELVHASIRDGIQLSMARSLKFRHNDIDHLKILLDKFGKGEQLEVYVITESVFSMDGDQAPLEELTQLTTKMNNAYLIVDEAHALGVIGHNGEGLVQYLGLEDQVFARVVTYGKALGCHGASILGSNDLVQYLINFCRTFIYTTALPPHALLTINAGYGHLENQHVHIKKLQILIQQFNKLVVQSGLRLRFRESETAIQVCIIPGNKNVRKVAGQLQHKGYDVRAILSPTVPEGQERLRLCLHSYNTIDDCEFVLETIAKSLKKK
ncbi:aminotransferase class I/II-fold pyridoxal phosphate-dependent enzyme [Nonlabens ulvanivorans]|uniref:aminotransferase class I/II-fold pyridoxal phosphate-dependent enzyme n=1 Tax=Nonlabens ulvanivorans TaxID=906888 RepID=UPI002943F51B|nr:8-amino-7-oxononanoate synthase [Nonlabens ulvanivorans]WOI22231.1 8-amino-7-oxononanoate synthase [Nonlabens ulvanivorans]